MSHLRAVSGIMTLTSILVSACFVAEAFYYGINRPGCGRSQALGRVVNGSIASKLQVPWVVNVIGAKPHASRVTCGGSIITRDAILTAAHCVRSRKVTVYYNTTVVLRGPRIKAKAVVIHRKFIKVFLGYDIALVRLAKPIPRFDSFVRPVCLPKQGEKTRRGPMVLAGYGRPGRRKPGRRLLYYIPTASSDATCDVDLEVEWSRHPMKRNLLICTKHPHAMMYHGDSGSPLTAYSRYGRWTQYGIASFIRSSNAGYAPTVSTRVSMFIDWIKWALRVTGRRKNRC